MVETPISHNDIKDIHNLISTESMPDLEVAVHNLFQRIIDYPINNETALGVALNLNNQELVDYILNIGAGVDTAADKFDTPPIGIAARQGNLQVLRCLMDRGANVYARDRHNNTALHLAASNGHVECIKYLLDYLNIEEQGIQGSTPLLQAAATQDESVIDFMVSNGAALKAQNNNGWCALHYAAYKNNTGVLEYLLGYIDINSTNNLKNTPLHVACRNNCIDAAIVLIKAGANLNVLNNNGQKPLDCFKDIGDTKLLLEHLAGLANDGKEYISLQEKLQQYEQQCIMEIAEKEVLRKENAKLEFQLKTMKKLLKRKSVGSP